MIMVIYLDGRCDSCGGAKLTITEDDSVKFIADCSRCGRRELFWYDSFYHVPPSQWKRAEVVKTDPIPPTFPDDPVDDSVLDWQI